MEYTVKVFSISFQELANPLSEVTQELDLFCLGCLNLCGFLQISIASNMPVIILLIATSSFPRRVSKKHITINCLILTALLPAQSGECKNVLWPFFKERLQGEGGRLINGWNQLNKWPCPVFISLLSEAWSSPTAPLAQSAVCRLLPDHLGIWASHGFVSLSFGKAISKLVCLFLTSAMPKPCGA